MFSSNFKASFYVQVVASDFYCVSLHVEGVPRDPYAGSLHIQAHSLNVVKWAFHIHVVYVNCVIVSLHIQVVPQDGVPFVVVRRFDVHSNAAAPSTVFTTTPFSNGKYLTRIIEFDRVGDPSATVTVIVEGVNGSGAWVVGSGFRKR